jgi:HAD superfamily hydrolase (TIGR01509 family)
VVSPRPITAVLFDFHATLADGGDPWAALDAAWTRAGREGTAAGALGPDRYRALAQGVHHLWDRVRDVDPQGLRDLSPEQHREVFDALMAPLPDMDEDLAGAVYEIMPELWRPYPDAMPTLRALRRRGIGLALVSDTDIDLRPILARWGMLDLFGAVVLSFEEGFVKPDARMFQRALDALGVPAADALMVGDNPVDDAGAAAIGVRTLLLPRTEGGGHGLGLVLRFVGGRRPPVPKPIWPGARP